MMFRKQDANMNNSQQHHSDAIQPENCNSALATKRASDSTNGLIGRGAKKKG
jgi:hypothetical protein